MEGKNFDYDNVSDSLIVSRKKIGEVVQGSAEVGNLILDFTSSGRVVSVEIQHISNFLEMMNISPDILNELTSVDLIVQNQRGDLFLATILHTPTLKQPLPLTTVPITKKLASSV